MSKYNYSREKVNGHWDINNPLDVDGNGKSVTLFSRIEENKLITLKCESVNCKGEDAIISFASELKTDEKAALDATVAAHKTASGSINKQTALKMVSSNGSKFNVCVSNAGVLEVMAI